MAEQKTGMSNGSQMRITEDEIRMIKGVFKDNEPLLKLMRKMFLPEIDPNAPIGQMIDLWMSVSIKDLTKEEALIRLEARNTLISHLDQVLMQLYLISQMEETSPAEVKAKLVANSTK